MLATLPENLTRPTADRLPAAGVAPLHGMAEASPPSTPPSAPARLGRRAGAAPAPVAAPAADGRDPAAEAEAKAALAAFGLAVPAAGHRRRRRSAAGRRASRSRFPLALKALGVAHKTEAGAVVLDSPTPRRRDAPRAAMARLGTASSPRRWSTDPVAELIVGVARDRDRAVP